MFEIPYGAVPLKDDSNEYIDRVMKNIIHNICLINELKIECDVSEIVIPNNSNINPILVNIFIDTYNIWNIADLNVIKFIHECITYCMYENYPSYYLKKIPIKYKYNNDPIGTYSEILKIE